MSEKTCKMCRETFFSSCHVIVLQILLKYNEYAMQSHTGTPYCLKYLSIINYNNKCYVPCTYFNGLVFSRCFTVLAVRVNKFLGSSKMH